MSESGHNGGVSLDRMAREDPFEKVTFKQKPEESEGEKP